MERRVFLAILLSFVVLFGYQAFFAPAPAPVPAPVGPAPSQPVQQTPGITAAQPAPAAPQSPAPAALVADTEARDIVVETDAVRAVFNTRGAVLTSWRLKNYQGADGQPLDLVPSELPA